MSLPSTRDLVGVDVAVVGIPFDTASTYRVGARFAPEAIRSISVLLRPYHPDLKVNILEISSVVDYGDLPVVPGYLEPSFHEIQEGIEGILRSQAVPVSIGGDHSITLPVLRALSRKYGKLSLIHCDSHSDTWPEYYGKYFTHGSPIYFAAKEGLIAPETSIQVGIRGPLYSEDDLERPGRLGLKCIRMSTVREKGIGWVIDQIKERVGSNMAYLSFDIDVVDPAFAPGTSTPEVGGLTSWEVLELVKGMEGLTFAGMDMVEVLPPYDQGQITSLLAANLIFQFLGVVAKKR